MSARPHRRLVLAEGSRVSRAGARRLAIRRRQPSPPEPPSGAGPESAAPAADARPLPSSAERLAPGQMLELFRLRARGDRAARARLVAANLNLVHHLVKRYRAMGLDGEDLFQVGCVGLVKAVDRFDPERGNRFSTYAVPVILGEIQRYLRDSATGFGRGAAQLAQQARREEQRLAGSLLRQPTVAEVAAAVGVSAAELAAVVEASRQPLPLDAQGRGDEQRSLLERIAGADGEDGDRLAVRTVLARLPARDRAILVLRFYLERSQAEVASQLGLSQPQISRLEKRALAAARTLWNGGPASGEGGDESHRIHPG